MSGLAATSDNGSNLDLGLYAIDTLDRNDRLSLTAGAGLDFRADPDARPDLALA